MTITEKVAYLKGLLEGLGVDAESKDGKIWKAVIDVLADVAISVEDLEATVEEMGEQVDTIDEDLDALETDYYDDDDCDCDCCDDEFYEITCPNCDEEFGVDEETLLDGGVECPNCGEHLEFDLSDCCDCDCDCDCCDDE